MKTKNEMTKVTVGMGATEHSGSDCYPYFVTSVSADGKTVGLTAADVEAYKNAAPMSNTWIVTPSTKTEPDVVLTWRYGAWYTGRKGAWHKAHFSFGVARKYYCYEF